MDMVTHHSLKNLGQGYFKIYIMFSVEPSYATRVYTTRVYTFICLKNEYDVFSLSKIYYVCPISLLVSIYYV